MSETKQQTHHYFLPVVRQGLAALIKEKDEAGVAQRARLKVTLSAKARRKDTSELDTADPLITTVDLYGPGDILGFDHRVVARTHPEPEVGDFEPNYFPSVEFTDADFAWRFTAAPPVFDGTGKLDPWITLIVLVAEERGDLKPEFAEGSRSEKALPKHIMVKRSALPDLQHVWRWAHVHVTGEPGIEDAVLLDRIAKEAEQAICRLLCARRLAPGTRYAAFVVPTFKLGVLTGLGRDLGTHAAMDRAWEGNADDGDLPYHVPQQERPAHLTDGVVLRLPYYFRWEFRTGLRGDFEQLVRLLEPRDLNDQVGKRDMDCGSPGFLSEGVIRPDLDSPEESHYLGLEGALRSLKTKYTAWGQDAEGASPAPPTPFQTKLADLINKPDVENIPFSPFKPDITGDGTFDVPPLPSVVPPIYGRWHYGKKKERTDGTKVVIDPDEQDTWIDQLNLDPRHRAAAGLGAQVVRKQQEALMASAWAQLGAIESTNDLLRRAQFGRESSFGLFRRLDHLLPEDFLRVTAPVHQRVITRDPKAGDKPTVAHYLWARTRIGEAVLDPAFRRIMRHRGPVKRRAKAPRSRDLLNRLAAGKLEPAGPPPKPLGTMRLCDISKRVPRKPEVDLRAEKTEVSLGTTMLLLWKTTDVASCTAFGAWTGEKLPAGLEKVGPLTQTCRFSLTGTNPFGSTTSSVVIKVTGSEVIPPPPPELLNKPIDESALRFCDGKITCDQIKFQVEEHDAFAPLANEPDAPAEMVRLLCDALKWLEDKPPDSYAPPEPNDTVVERMNDALRSSLNPAVTVVERTRQRLRLRGVLAERFASAGRRDPLDIVMSAPEFPQPMYEPLRDLSHALLIPGVEKIPQNSLCLLTSGPRRRFIESYLAGLNHEFAAELLWRGYPTDQRGSYFRQFWDVSQYVLRPDDANDLFSTWVGRYPNPATLRREKQRVLARHLDDVAGEIVKQLLKRRHLDNVAGEIVERLVKKWLSETAKTEDDLGKREKRLLRLIRDERAEAMFDLQETDLNALDDLVKALVVEERLQEKLKDVAPLATWKKPLGENQPEEREPESLVLVVRGDLLKRYPNTLIYAIDAVPCCCAKGEPVPGLAEYLKCYEKDDHGEVRLDDSGKPVVDETLTSSTLQEVRRIFPIFQATLPPDLTVFGFPFDEDQARSKYFVIEEPVSEPRFGLDAPNGASARPETWDDLSWSHFGFGVGNQDQNFGHFLETPLLNIEPPNPVSAEGKDWSNASAATRAWITLQKPVRVAVHATKMLPKKGTPG